MKKFFDSLINPFQRTLADVPWFGFILSAVVVASLINVLTNSLSELGGSLYGWIFIGALLVGIILYVVNYNRKYTRWVRNLGPIVDVNSPGKYEGLIFLFSNKETLQAAIHHHQPVLRHTWLIVTPEKQGEAGKVLADFPGVKFSILPIAGLYDTQSCYNVVQRIYRTSTADEGIKPENTISDITGGTKPMTMGMIVACIEGGYPIEHVPTKYDSTGKPGGPLPPIEIRLKHN